LPEEIIGTVAELESVGVNPSAEGTVQITDYERVWIEGLNRGDASVASDVFASDGVIHINGSPDPNLSVDGFKQMISGLLSAFPDLRLTIEDQIVAGDKVATRWSAEGTNNGPFGPVAATGRRVRINGLILDRVADGKVVERWEQWDQMSMMQQLGLA
jgi:predicted ester cyclase